MQALPTRTTTTTTTTTRQQQQNNNNNKRRNMKNHHAGHNNTPSRYYEQLPAASASAADDDDDDHDHDDDGNKPELFPAPASMLVFLVPRRNCWSYGSSRRRCYMLAALLFILSVSLLSLGWWWMMIISAEIYYNKTPASAATAATATTIYKTSLVIIADGNASSAPNSTEHQQSGGGEQQQQQQQQQILRLRRPWKYLEAKSSLAKRIVKHQNNCSLPMATFSHRKKTGLGSDLHFWGQGVLNGMHRGWRLRTIGNWTFLDEQHCSLSSSSSFSPMLCYFGSIELNCPGDMEVAIQHPRFEKNQYHFTKPDGRLYSLDFPEEEEQGTTTPSSSSSSSRSKVRTSLTEFLFLHVQPIVIQEAERQLNLVFQGLKEVPKDLITVHIRWGDKGSEMELVEIHEYISAIQQILEERRRRRRRRLASSTNNTTTTSSSGDNGTTPASNHHHTNVNIYLATEDPEAVRQFQQAMPNDWNLYLEHAYSELINHRVPELDGSAKMAKALKGRVGLISLGSLLVAMEANDFVMTTGSNWSRLMNELRTAFFSSSDDDDTTSSSSSSTTTTTRMIDLRPEHNEW